MKLVGRIVLAGASMVIAGLAAASPALAYNTPSYWNVSSTPLVITGYGSTANAYGYISIYNGSNGTRMTSYAYDRFIDGDNHMAYITTLAQYNAGSCSSQTSTIYVKGAEVSSSSQCAQQFYDAGTIRQNGLNYTQWSWAGMQLGSFGVNNGADRGRVRVELSIDVPFRTDPSSGGSYSTADTW